MDKTADSKKYLSWILRSVLPGEMLIEIPRYQMILAEKIAELHNIDFEVSIPFDDNRVGDAINLRYRYGDVTGTPGYVIADTIDRWPPSVLEVIAALALRAGEQLVGYPFVMQGARWIFMEIINNLHIHSAVDETDIQIIADSLNKRLYSKDGYGGPFYIPDCETDMRNMELWKQLTIYLQLNKKRFTDSIKNYQ